MDALGDGQVSQGVIKVGHGGTLDPLATVVLVIGIGRGTKELSSYLSGTKKYRALGRFGIETTTLDLEGNITKTVSYSSCLTLVVISRRTKTVIQLT